MGLSKPRLLTKTNTARAKMMNRMLLIALLLLPASWSNADELTDIFAKVSPSVGALYKRTSNGSIEFLCSITAVDHRAGETVVLSARHCVSKDVAFMVSFDGDQFHSARVWKLPHDALDKSRYPRPYGESRTDMALFLVAGEFPTIPLGDDTDARPGDPIAVVGFPLGVTKIRYSGYIAGRLNRPGDDQDGYLILQSFGAPGSSGSSVVSVATGEVIAVLVSGQSGRSGLPVIFATPISYQKYLCDVHAPELDKACAIPLTSEGT